jgi:hypothetical protein
MRTVLGRLGLMPMAKSLSSEEGHRILARDRYTCRYCGLDGLSSFENSLVMTVDYVTPRARKGKKDPQNLVAACRPCNVIKGHRVFNDFEEAKAYVLKKREVLRGEWEARLVQLKRSPHAART